MGWYEPPTEGVVLDAVTTDVERWYLAEAARDVEGMKRIAARIAQRRADLDHRVWDVDRWVDADVALRRVETAVAVHDPTPDPQHVSQRPVLPAWAARDSETLWQRWWPTYLGVAAGGAVLTLLVWFVLALIEALAALVAAVASLVMGAVGVLALLACVVFLARLGGGGGRGFSGTFQGRMH